jgi:membrane protein YqaA with SNARE-associated domain
MGQYIALAAVVFGINLLPAFGPPTWAVLVLYRLNSNLAAVPLVLVGATAAAAGRFVLATVSGHFRGRLSTTRLEGLDAVRDALGAHRGRSFVVLGLFALSPVPSAQLFVAAGLVAAPLVPLTAAFFVGRLVSYSIYVGVASVARNSVGGLFEQSFRSPLGIALQIVALLLLVLLVRVDWLKLLGRVGIAPEGRG